jgi:hypothetical protein
MMTLSATKSKRSREKHSNIKFSGVIGRSFQCSGRNKVSADIFAYHETLNMRHSSCVASLTMFSKVAQLLLEHLEQVLSHK